MKRNNYLKFSAILLSLSLTAGILPAVSVTTVYAEPREQADQQNGQIEEAEQQSAQNEQSRQNLQTQNTSEELDQSSAIEIEANNGFDPDSVIVPPTDQTEVSGEDADQLYRPAEQPAAPNIPGIHHAPARPNTEENRNLAGSFQISDDQQEVTFSLPETDGYYMLKVGENPVFIADGGSNVDLELAEGGFEQGDNMLELLYSPDLEGDYEFYSYAGQIELTDTGLMVSSPYAENNAYFMSQLPTDAASLKLLTQQILPANYSDKFPRVLSSESAVISAKDAALAAYPDAGSAAEKLYDYVLDTLSYDINTVGDKQDALTCLSRKTAVCEGYASLLCALMRADNIPCLKVDGYAYVGQQDTTANHAWVAAYLNGGWQIIDPTFGDSKYKSTRERWFSVSQEDIASDRRIDNFDSEVAPAGIQIALDPEKIEIQAGQTAKTRAYILPLWADQKSGWPKRIKYDSNPKGCIEIPANSSGKQEAHIMNGVTIDFVGKSAGNVQFPYTFTYPAYTDPATGVAVSAQTVSATCNVTITQAASQPAQTTPSQPANTQSSVASQDMYRLYNPNSGEHFYTANAGERDYLDKIGWNYEGIGWKAPVTSSHPVYRLYNPNAGDHHYTMNAGERDSLVRAGWNYEGIGWYSDDSESIPLYRQYNPRAKAGSHNYTTNKGENDYLASIGWNAEGIGWYGMAG